MRGVRAVGSATKDVSLAAKAKVTTKVAALALSTNQAEVSTHPHAKLRAQEGQGKVK